MVPPKSSPNELAFTITRYRKSKLSSLAEKFTRRSPSLGARFAPPLSSREAVYRSNFNLPHTGHTVVRVCFTHTDRSCVCVRVARPHVCAYNARMREERRQRTAMVKYRRTTPFSYSPRCIRAYPLSILGQVFTLASSERRYVRRTGDHGDRVRRRRDRPKIHSR